MYSKRKTTGAKCVLYISGKKLMFKEMRLTFLLNTEHKMAVLNVCLSSACSFAASYES